MSKAAPSRSSKDAIFLATSALASAARASNQGSVIVRQTEVLDRDAGSRARNPAQLDLATQSSSSLRLALERAIRAGRPPRPSAQPSASSQSSTATIDGVLMVSPWKMPSVGLPLEVMRKILGSGQG